MEENIGIHLVVREKLHDWNFIFANLGVEREGDDCEVEIGQRDLKAFAIEE